MKKRMNKIPLDAQESNRVRYLIREAIFTKYRDDSAISNYYRCSKCYKAYIREDRLSSNLFKIRGHSHHCPTRQIEIKSEIDEEHQENNLGNDLEEMSDSILAPATRKESSESNDTQNIFKKLFKQLVPIEEKEEKVENKSLSLKERLKSIVNSFGGFYSNK